ncbi:MAG: histidine kinase [Salibacteraceae bacterium]
MTASRNYYIAQITGWSAYILVSTGVFLLSGRELDWPSIGGIYLVFALGILLTHVYRFTIIRLGWLNFNLSKLVPRVSVASVALSLLFHVIYLGLGNAVFGWNKSFQWDDQNLFAWIMLFLIWNLIYFSYIFFQRYRTEEIKNLKLEAARNEYELRRLRDQMNPHFIFNAMNTVRALIDDEPAKAKKAVTQLSNVLRSSLQTGKQEFISLETELQIVSDYLEIEKARYEERLKVFFQVDPKTHNTYIPPLILQTLVENCIKHGISKLPQGGEIKLITQLHDGFTTIEILNTGQYDPKEASNGSLGLENTRNRLDLSYGKEAWLTIGNADNSNVRTMIHLPIKPKNK